MHTCYTWRLVKLRYLLQNLYTIDLLFHILGSNNIQLCNQLCEIVNGTQVGDILLKVDHNSNEDFYTRYLHDFVHMCTQSDDSRECEVS